MADQQKTPWRKNLDPRYISGEDLAAEQKGLKKEMVVTIVRYEDVPTFDQKKQAEVDKTALWLKEYPNGAILYKPCILNVGRGEFLSKEIGNNSLFIDDFDNTKPFVMYAKPDKRFGFVVAFKKYFPPIAITPDKALKALSDCTTLDSLAEAWKKLSAEEKELVVVMNKKDELKKHLTASNPEAK